MSRSLLCAPCAEGRPAGSHLLLAGSTTERAEYERIVWGLARRPAPGQTDIYITAAVLEGADNEVVGANDIRIPGAQTFVCDRCNATINPGDRACARTIWVEGRTEPSIWEHEYLNHDDEDH